MSNFSSDAPRQGASTISQQVVKNEFLAGLPRDGRYKGLQAHYATMLEKKMSKNAILERYLNTVFFGNNAYGLQAAAEVYFGKNVGDLTMIEGAFLAGLVRSPSGFDPIRHSERGACPLPSGDRAAGRCRTGRAGRRLAAGLDVEDAGARADHSHVHHQTDVLHGGDQGVSAEPCDVPRRRAAASQLALPRRLEDPHDLRSKPAGARRAGPHATPGERARLRRRRRHARHQDRCDTRHGRWARVPATCRRDQHGAGATPNRLEHQAVHPRCRARGRRATDRRDRRYDTVHVRRTPTTRRSRSSSRVRQVAVW